MSPEKRIGLNSCFARTLRGRSAVGADIIRPRRSVYHSIRFPANSQWLNLCRRGGACPSRTAPLAPSRNKKANPQNCITADSPFVYGIVKTERREGQAPPLHPNLCIQRVMMRGNLSFYSSSQLSIICRITLSVSRMPSLARMPMLRIVPSTPRVTMPSPPRKRLPFWAMA